MERERQYFFNFDEFEKALSELYEILSRFFVNAFLENFISKSCQHAAESAIEGCAALDTLVGDMIELFDVHSAASHGKRAPFFREGYGHRPKS